MAASRLGNSQKLELLELYRLGETTSVLAARFGCSPNTVTRTVRSLLLPEEYTALKSQRGRTAIAPKLEQVQVLYDQGERSLDHTELALDDADDFSSGDEDEGSDPESNETVNPDEETVNPDEDEEATYKFVPLPLGNTDTEQDVVVAQPYRGDLLPVSVYLLVDRSVELDPRTLNTLPGLGLLSDSELERQALVLYSNPRAAKRQCSRNQRVIKVPDSSVFQRTIPFLLARGITRLVIEGGALLALDSISQEPT